MMDKIESLLDCDARRPDPDFSAKSAGETLYQSWKAKKKIQCCQAAGNTMTAW
jgi:hypothetical protein